MTTTGVIVAGIAAVEFFIGWNKVGEDGSPPYNMIWWNEQPLGIHEISARAVGLNGYRSADMVRIEIVSTVSDEIGETAGWDAPRVYPNPAGTDPSLYMYTSAPGKVEIILYDAAGRIAGRQVLASPARGYHAFELDTRGYASGVYFYRAATAAGIRTGRFVIIR